MPDRDFNSKRLEYALDTNNTVALIDDLKKWIHIADKVQCQVALPLFQRCLRHIHNHMNDQMKREHGRDRVFSFGPLVMRMMHFFNTPEQALQVRILTIHFFREIWWPKYGFLLYYSDVLRPTTQWAVSPNELFNHFVRYAVQQWNVSGCGEFSSGAIG